MAQESTKITLDLTQKKGMSIQTVFSRTHASYFSFQIFIQHCCHTLDILITEPNSYTSDYKTLYICSTWNNTAVRKLGCFT